MIGPTEIVFCLMALCLVYGILVYPIQGQIWRSVRPPTERKLIKTVQKHRAEEERHRQLRQEAEAELRRLRERAKKEAEA